MKYLSNLKTHNDKEDEKEWSSKDFEDLDEQLPTFQKNNTIGLTDDISKKLHKKFDHLNSLLE